MQAFLRSEAFKITAYVAAVILCGALLAPVLHGWAQWALARGYFDTGPLSAVRDPVAESPFTRYFSRAMQLAALLLAWPFLKWLGTPGQLKGSGWLMLRANPRRTADFFVGFAIAAGTLLALGGIYLATGWYRPNPDAAPLHRMLLAALASGLAVGFLEEFLFRGAMLALILRTVKPLPALVFLSAFFAVVHFLRPPDKLELPPVAWDSGLWLLGKIFAQWGDARFLLAELALLFCVGWVLGWARLKTGSLWLPIGLHAGWVFGVKFFSAATRRAVPLAAMLPWAGPNLRVGINSVLAVCLCGLAVWLMARRRHPESAFASPEARAS